MRKSIIALDAIEQRSLVGYIYTDLDANKNVMAVYFECEDGDIYLLEKETPLRLILNNNVLSYIDIMVEDVFSTKNDMGNPLYAGMDAMLKNEVGFMATKKTSLQRGPEVNNNTTNITQTTNNLNAEYPKSENVQYIEETSNLFSRLYKQHGNYFIEEYRQHHQTMVDFFTAISTRDLRMALRLPENAFKSLIEKELNARKSYIRTLKARGRLCRQEEQLCLI